MNARAAAKAQLPGDGSWPVIARLVLAVASERLQLIAVRKSIGRHRRRQARRERGAR
jgi:hypothetical protein